MATESFGWQIVVTEKNIENLVYAAEHPVNFAEKYKDMPMVRRSTEEDIQRIIEHYGI